MISPLRHLLLCSLLLLGACASAPTTRPAHPKTAYSAAALRWEGAALHLPKDSPVVLTLRADLVIGALKNLFEWTIADPALFGMPAIASGVVRFLLQRREMLKEDFGFDLLDMNAWPDWFETDLSVHVGMYPLSAQGHQFIATYEDQLRQAVGAPPAQPLLIATDSPTQPPTQGLHAGLWRSLGEVNPELGLRVVGETGEPSKLRQWFERDTLALFSSPYDDMAKKAGLAKVLMMEATSSALVITLDLSVPGLFILDLILTPPVEEFSDPQKLAHVQATLDRKPPAGRPMAPKPSPQTEHALSLALERQGVTDWLNMIGFEAALEGAATLEATERDGQLVKNTAMILKSHGAWSQATDFAPHIAYELDFPDAKDTVARFGMVLFPDVSPLPLPKIAPSPHSLNIPTRNLGASLYPELTWGPDWQRWAGPSVLRPCQQATENLEQSRGIVEFMVWMSGLPMCGAAALSNLRDATALLGLPADALPGGTFIKKIRHIESTLPDGDLSNFQLNPRGLVLIDLMPETAQMDRKAFGNFVHTVAQGLLEDESSRPQDPTANAGAVMLTSRTISPLEPDGPLAAITYYWDQEADTPWLLLGYGVNPQAFKQEVQRLDGIKNRDTGDAALFVKINPLIVLEVTSTFEQRFGTLLNWGNLSQRLGSLEFMVQPEQPDPGDEGSRLIRYDLTLKAPPSL